MDKSIVNSLLVWLLAGGACAGIAALLSRGNKDDFYFILSFSVFAGILLAALVSGGLSCTGTASLPLSLVIAALLSLCMGYGLRHDLGFWNYNGSLAHLLKIAKNCLLLLPLSYFGLGYLLVWLFKKGLRLFGGG